LLATHPEEWYTARIVIGVSSSINVVSKLHPQVMISYRIVEQPPILACCNYACTGKKKKVLG
jgi:hypothetical protein